MNAAESETFLPVTNEFLDSILRLKLRVAAFDCDGTLWSGDAGERFFDWELREGELIPRDLDRPLRERYAAYKRGEVDETTMCGEMVTMHRGISEVKLMDAATRFFDQFFVVQIFPEMRELVRRLQENGCEVWAVSSSNEWVIRAAMKHFGIPGEPHTCRQGGSRAWHRYRSTDPRAFRRGQTGGSPRRGQEGNRRRFRQFPLGSGHAGNGEACLCGEPES